MRFLVDENLSWRLAELLAEAGHDAVHVRDLHAAGAPDIAVLALAVADERVIISADTDFGALLAQSRATKPSVILVRAIAGRRPTDLARTILTHLYLLEAHLKSGAVAAFSEADVRVRPLPLR